MYTTAGSELARLTVINADLKTVYESLVRPEHKIVDYNTRFSGITAEHMRGVKTTLRDVQAILLSMFNDRTILIGHSLESDFTALKVCLHLFLCASNFVRLHLAIDICLSARLSNACTLTKRNNCM